MLIERLTRLDKEFNGSIAFLFLQRMDLWHVLNRILTTKSTIEQNNCSIWQTSMLSPSTCPTGSRRQDNKNRRSQTACGNFIFCLVGHASLFSHVWLNCKRRKRTKTKKWFLNISAMTQSIQWIMNVLAGFRSLSACARSLSTVLRPSITTKTEKEAIGQETAAIVMIKNVKKPEKSKRCFPFSS